MERHRSVLPRFDSGAYRTQNRKNLRVAQTSFLSSERGRSFITRYSAHAHDAGGVLCRRAYVRPADQTAAAAAGRSVAGKIDCMPDSSLLIKYLWRGYSVRRCSLLVSILDHAWPNGAAAEPGKLNMVSLSFGWETRSDAARVSVILGILLQPAECGNVAGSVLSYVI